MIHDDTIVITVTGGGQQRHVPATGSLPTYVCLAPWLCSHGMGDSVKQASHWKTLLKAAVTNLSLMVWLVTGPYMDVSVSSEDVVVEDKRLDQSFCGFPVLLKDNSSSSIPWEPKGSVSGPVNFLSKLPQIKRWEVRWRISRALYSFRCTASLSSQCVAVNNKCSTFFTIISKERNSAGVQRPQSVPCAHRGLV